MNTWVAITVLLVALVCVIPVVWIAFLTWNAVDSISFMPEFYIPQAVAFLLWWVGFCAAWLIARRKIQMRPIPFPIIVSLVIGLIACVWLEYESWHDPKHLFFPSFFLIPIAGGVMVAAKAKMLSNPKFKRDANDAPQLKR